MGARGWYTGACLLVRRSAFEAIASGCLVVGRAVAADFDGGAERFFPELVIETGVRHGVCSSFILAALDMNNAGVLTSIDPIWESQKQATRKIIDLIFTPAHYFDRWQFYSGPSKDFLPHLPVRRQVDIFVHDSDHGFINMSWELEWAWEQGVRPGGLIICDDWDWQENDELHLHEAGNVVEQFCQRHDCDFHTIGTAAVIEVPM